MEMTSTDAEFTQGKNIADLCAELGVKHVIISTVPNVLKESGGRYPNAMHWQVKAEIAEYMQSIGLPLTRFEPGSFTQNLKMIRKVHPPLAPSIRTQLTPVKGEDGAYRLAWPIAAGAKIPYFDPARDTGKFIVPVLLDPKKWIGGRILGAAGWWSGTEIADLFNEVNPGSKLEYEEISEEEYAKSIPPGIVPMMLDQMRWIRDYAYFGENAVADVEESLKVGVDCFLVHARDWLMWLIVLGGKAGWDQGVPGGGGGVVIGKGWRRGIVSGAVYVMIDCLRLLIGKRALGLGLSLVLNIVFLAEAQPEQKCCSQR